LSKDQVAEILVLCQQQPILAIRTIHDLRIGRTRRNVSHVNNVTP